MSGAIVALFCIFQLILLVLNEFFLTGKPPDFLAFGITLMMTMVLVAGVKKSLFFNNVLNAINLSVWVFIVTAGLFYVDTNNWTQHKGFLPFGWSGVSSKIKIELLLIYLTIYSSFKLVHLVTYIFLIQCIKIDSVSNFSIQCFSTYLSLRRMWAMKFTQYKN